MEKAYIAIDMKSFYASVECVARGLDPLSARLLVADESRTDQTICLAVSPALKAIGVSSRPRLFEAKQAIAAHERRSGEKVQYITAVPRMALYEKVSAQIYGILLRYAAPEDIHVYSVDESFVDCTPYLRFYRQEAARQRVHPARVMAMTVIRDVLRSTGITATVGIGTNLYLAKVAMDIVAKKKAPDADGVRVAELNEASYCFLLWDHRPLTDFWMLGPGKARTLQRAGLFTMGDIAARAQWDEEWFYRRFGIDAEILIDHAFGIEPVGMRDIKEYRSASRSFSHGQVLPRPYAWDEARNVLLEMIDVLCADLLSKGLRSASFTWWVSYDYRSLEVCPNYTGPVVCDFYGRPHPRHSNGTARPCAGTSSPALVAECVLASFDRKTDPRLLFRRLGLCAGELTEDTGALQLDFFTDYAAVEKERKMRCTLLELHRRFGLNSVFRGNNLVPGANQLERNRQIGGHRA